MTAHVFRYTKNSHGKPAAHPIAGAHAGLASFLTEEAYWADYADLLLDCVNVAKKTGKPQVNTGNAFMVTVDSAQAIIEHLHIKNHPRVTVPVAIFAQAVGEWREFLAKP